RRGRSISWSSRWGCGSPRARSHGSVRASTSRWRRSATGRSRAATPTCGWTRRSRRSATAAASSRRRSCSPTPCTSSGYREVIGLDVGECETEAFWRGFLRGLVDRGLRGEQLVVSDAHAGLKSAIAQTLECPWQRCTVHFLREALGHVRKDQQGMVAALLRPILKPAGREQGRTLSGDALDRLHKPLPKVAALLEQAEEDLLAFYSFPRDHWPKLRSTNPLERVNREVGRRTDVVGIFPNDKALIRLAASVIIEQNDEWLVGHRYLSAHSLEAILTDFNKDNKQEEARELTAA